MKATYAMLVICKNCGDGRIGGLRVDIPKGRPISSHPCPTCGVKALAPK